MEQCGQVEVFRLLLLCWLVGGPVQGQVRHPLPMLWMMPVTSGSGRENLTAAVMPAVQLALQDLKKQPPPLGNYDIQLQLLDSQCDPAKSLKALFDAMWAGPKYLLLFGEVCPPVMALIARSLPALSLVQVSFAATPPSLSNRKWYGNLFSTTPSDRALNQATVKLLQRYKWTRVGVVTQEGPRYSEMKKDLMRQLLKADIQVVSVESVSDDACSSLKKLQERDVRIIIAQFDEDSEVFCCAHALNMFGARYQWITVDGGTAGWRLGWKVSGCTASSLLTAASGSIRLQIRQLGNTNTPGVSGRTPQDYQDSYLRQLNREGSEVSPIQLHPFAYDAVWVAAKALTQVMEAVKHREKYSVQRNVTVGEEVQRRLLEVVKSTQFEGVTGPVFFRNGERMTTIELIQIQGSSGVLVGEFNTSNQQLRLMHRLLKFKGQRPARDQALIRLQHRHVGLLLYVIVSSAAAVTVIVTLLILCCTFISHKHWLLRSSSRSHDELLLLGVLLSSCSVLVSGLDAASASDWMFEISCSVHLWTLSVGHTVSFSVLFTKTWRIYSVYSIKQKSQSRCVLILMLLLDVFVLTSWQILDPLRRVVLHHRLESDAADQDVLIQPYSEHCSSINMELWLTAVYGYKGPLLGLGCFLAWNIRSAQVDHPALGSKPLTLSVFAVAAFTVAGVAGSLLTSHSRPVHFCLSSVLILCCSIFILSCMFGPKIFSLCCGGSEQQEQPSELQSDEDELSRLNQQLKSRTAQLDVEIETITMQLSEMSESEMLQVTTTNAELRSVTSTHEVQISAEDKTSERKSSVLDHINSPELVQRRLSVQLPILHHSYLPTVGGVSYSSSSLFGSQEAFVHHGVEVTHPVQLRGRSCSHVTD